jgi:wobble nucleotide-excising tRNase
MIRRLQLLRNVGQFDSVDSAATISLARLVLIYAENGRGKTTLAAVLRSLATDDPVPITERRRLTAVHPPHVVLDCEGEPPEAMFQDGVWNRGLPNLVVFDDVFVDQNVYSGLAVEAGHRKNLHELVLGAQGATLSHRLQDLVGRIEQHNRELRDKARAIPEGERRGLPVDDFCALEAHPEIELKIQETERVLAAAREQEPVRNTPPFKTLTLPAFDLDAIDRILGEDLPALDAAAAARVQEHVATLGAGGEQWIGEGMRRLPHPEPDTSAAVCPFCAQDLGGSPVIAHYRAYFSEAYAGLKRKIDEALAHVQRTHAGEVCAGFERAVRVAGERRQFWSQFCEVPEVEVDTAEIVRDWSAAREAVAGALSRKQAAPLETMALEQAARNVVATYASHRERIAALNAGLVGANEAIAVVKEQAAGADAQAITRNLTQMRATRARHTPEIAALCDEYLAEKVAKARTEGDRDQARAELDDYKTNVFPGYETAVNLYLQRFNAGFRLDSVTSTSTRGGPACTYNVLINDTPVPVAGGNTTPGEPSFRNTLSSGDRNTLTLAFFFASLDQDPELVNKIVVIDDPISSLDDHRSLTTVQQTRRLAERAGQVIVLSHNKLFLCRIWEGANPSCRTALEMVRQREGSTIQNWNVDLDSVTEHDRRHALLRNYLANGSPNRQEVARAIRPLLESFLRVACPEHFPPGTLLGPFHRLCAERVGSAREVLDGDATRELHEIKEYANRFHHDTNPAWETEAINDAELRGFVDRALNFARRQE